jgi:hypothetical protein
LGAGRGSTAGAACLHASATAGRSDGCDVLVLSALSTLSPHCLCQDVTFLAMSTYNSGARGLMCDIASLNALLSAPLPPPGATIARSPSHPVVSGAAVATGTGSGSCNGNAPPATVAGAAAASATKCVGGGADDDEAARAKKVASPEARQEMRRLQRRYRAADAAVGAAAAKGQAATSVTPAMLKQLDRLVQARGPERGGGAGAPVGCTRGQGRCPLPATDALSANLSGVLR